MNSTHTDLFAQVFRERFFQSYIAEQNMVGAARSRGHGQGAVRCDVCVLSLARRERRVSMTWMQRLKRLFAIEIETCRHCGGRLRVIASIEDPVLIERIFAHLERPDDNKLRAPFVARAPPQPPLL